MIVAVNFSPLKPSALHAYVPSPLSTQVASPLVVAADESLEELLFPLSVELVASDTFVNDPTATIITKQIAEIIAVLLRILAASLIWLPSNNLSIAGVNIFINRIEYRTPSDILLLKRNNTVKHPAPTPYTILPGNVTGVVTGSVTMNTPPNNTPPASTLTNA